MEEKRETNQEELKEVLKQVENGTEKTEEKDELQEKIEKYKKINKRLKIVFWIVLLLVIGFAAWTVYSMYCKVNEPVVEMKPIIYIYPEEEMKVTITANHPENFTTTYPKYEEGWQVIAKPNGDLQDVKTGRSFYSLYWEGKRNAEPTFQEGFVVKGEETASFLEEKLQILGLNEREAQEFIIFWLPKMEANPYNVICFETKEEIEQNMQLNISPIPDTVIRVRMDFKPIQQWQEIPEQKLEKIQREGYTVVEWGGTEIK